jgi:hypothetical protein
MPFKIQAFVITGKHLPKHIGKAYGRHIFRRLHVGPVGNALWLRDLPTSIFDLDREYGFTDALQAYHAECGRTGQEKLI